MINASSREQILKGLVYNLNELIKKVKKAGTSINANFIEELISQAPCRNESANQNKCEGFRLEFNLQKKESPYQFDCICTRLNKKFKANISANYLKRLESHWPLKKGMVDSKSIAWQKVNSAYETVQISIAFMIKCTSVENYRESNEENKKQLTQESYFKNYENMNSYFSFLIAYEKVFIHSSIKLFFWSDIKLMYHSYFIKEDLKKDDRVQFVNYILPKKTAIVLCLEDTLFRLRSGINFELHAFELFINDMVYADNSLIIFSTQNFIQESDKSKSYFQDYSVSFKRNLDETKISLQQAMEPDYKIAQDDRFNEPNKTGSFDKIVELLAKGQKYIEAIEKDIVQWKTKFEN
ncbi:hypothetical protein [Fluviispira sanaruensis]|uniref:Uncharacterized protein n=1 Tax=Fluviispira sanaruensis TaxID=2493639 RepID=A0A4P2VKV5_FLUSA|nr:hypothetical protein [Fluviispira sanaruensis]BBH51949.1 hypothetical protein JCM31447_03780 [Fluviispira sanaruensis]